MAKQLGKLFIPLFTGFYTSQVVVWDLFSIIIVVFCCHLGPGKMKNIHSLKNSGLEDEFWEDFLVSAVLVFWEGNMAYKLAYKLIALALS